MVVATGRDEGRLITETGLQLEAEHTAVEAERAVEIRHLEMDVTDLDTGVDWRAHTSERSVHIVTQAHRNVLATNANAGSVALVTGGGTGLGRSIALELARTGADIVVCGRRPEPLASVAAEIEALGRGVLAVPTDLRESDQVEALVTAALARFGRIDVLVNNAGGQFVAAAEDITANGWRAVHRLNVDAVWEVTRAVARASMLPRRSGVVLFVGLSPRRGIQGMAHGAAARAAVENLAAGLALEWSARGIRSVCLAVGNVETEGAVAAYGAEEVASWSSPVPLGRLGTPEEIAGVAAFLVSPGAAYITGTTVVVDGGLDAWGHGPYRP